MAKNIFLILLITLSLNSYGVDENKDALKDKIKPWYDAITGSDTNVFSPGEFEATIRGYFHYRKKNKIPNKNFMGIINYPKFSAKEARLFVFQIGQNPKMIWKEWVAHGAGKPGTPFFTNKPYTHRSSKGFIKTGIIRTPKSHPDATYKNALELHGLESSVNGNIHGRGIIMHSASYVGPNGSGLSHGCPAVPTVRYKENKHLLKGGVLIYISDGESHNNYSFMKGVRVTDETLSQISSEDNPSPVWNDEGKPYPGNIASAESPSGEYSVQNGSKDNGIIGIAAIVGLPLIMMMMNKEDEEDKKTLSNEVSNNAQVNTNAALHGTAAFTDCQNRSSAPWAEVVKEANLPNGNPAKFFTGTYKDMNERANQMVQTPDHVRRKMGTNNYHSNTNCIALARSMGKTNFSKINPNQPETYESSDGKIKCRYEGAESQDYEACKKLADAHSKGLEDQKTSENEQSESFQKAVEGTLKTLNEAGGIQKESLAEQEKLTQKGADTAQDRVVFETGRINLINKAQAAMPNRNSILADCRSYMNGREAGKGDLKAYLNYLEIEDRSIPNLPDPCLAVSKLMKVNLVQNIPARKQAIKIIEKAGIKVEGLNEKERALLNQVDQIHNNNLKGARGDAFKHNTYNNIEEDISENSKLRLDKRRQNKNGCTGNNCQGNYNNSNNGQLSFENAKAYRPNFGKKTSGGVNPYSSITSGQNNHDGKNSGKRNGFYNNRFYKQVTLALNGQIPPSSLTPRQRKEYNAMIKYRNERSRANHSRNKTHNGKKNNNKSAISEIWFDKKLDLFSIISHRYRKVQADPRETRLMSQ